MARDPEPDLLQPVDGRVRSDAQRMLRTARVGALALLDPDTGAPATGRVGVATDPDGAPLFPVSSLSGRVAAMDRDDRASLLVGVVGKGDPLAHGRLAMNGRVRRLDDDDDARARRRYLAKHPKAKLYLGFADFSLWRLDIESASFVAGFGRASALVRTDLVAPRDDWEVWHAMEPGAVARLNDDRDAVALYATELAGAPNGKWRITGLDPDGLDLAAGDDHRRVFFPSPLTHPDELRLALVRLTQQARASD